MKYRTAEASLQAMHPVTAAATPLSTHNDLPAIPASSRMIELMETAAARLMKPNLGDAESSVAVAMNVTYAAVSLRHPKGVSTMRAVATYKGISGRLHRFTINAFDGSGLIGTAEHTRSIVMERGLMSMARERAVDPGMLSMV